MGSFLETSYNQFKVVQFLLAEDALQMAGQFLRLVRGELLSKKGRDPDELHALVPGQRLEKVVQISRIGAPLHLEHNLESLEGARRALEDPRPPLQLEGGSVDERSGRPLVGRGAEAGPGADQSAHGGDISVRGACRLQQGEHSPWRHLQRAQLVQYQMRLGPQQAGQVADDPRREALQLSSKYVGVLGDGGQVVGRQEFGHGHVDGRVQVRFSPLAERQSFGEEAKPGHLDPSTPCAELGLRVATPAFPERGQRHLTEVFQSFPAMARDLLVVRDGWIQTPLHDALDRCLNQRAGLRWQTPRVLRTERFNVLLFLFRNNNGISDKLERTRSIKTYIHINTW